MTVDRSAAPRGNAALAWLGHPVTLLALALLLLNDHVLKAAYPGWWTGKLSDAAGLVVAPPLLALLARRVPAWVPVMVTGVGFVLVKSSTHGAVAASAAWGLVWPGSVVRADLTDLCTLPAVGLSWLVWRSATATPVPPAWVRAARLAIVLPAALFGVAATGAPIYPSATVAGVDGERLVAGVRNLYHGPGAPDWTVSTDGGRTWVAASPDAVRRFAGRPAEGQACAAEVCYRVSAGHLRVERSADGGGTWATDWEIGHRQRMSMARTYDGIDDVDRDLSSVSVAVQPRPGGGHVVLGANGRDGFALRHPDGRWERIGYVGLGGYAETVGDVESYAVGRAWDRGLGVLLAVALGFATVSVGCARAARRLGTAAWSSVLTLLLGFPLTVLFLMFAGPADSVLAMGIWPAAVLAVLAVAGVTITQAVLVAVRTASPGRWLAALAASGVLTVLLVAAVFVLWLGSLLIGVPLVLALTLAAWVPGIVVAWFAARLVTNRPPVPEPPYPVAA
jgi:hypothetical protein